MVNSNNSNNFQTVKDKIPWTSKEDEILITQATWRRLVQTALTTRTLTNLLQSQARYRIKTVTGINFPVVISIIKTEMSPSQISLCNMAKITQRENKMVQIIGKFSETQICTKTFIICLTYIKAEIIKFHHKLNCLSKSLMKSEMLVTIKLNEDWGKGYLLIVGLQNLIQWITCNLKMYPLWQQGWMNSTQKRFKCWSQHIRTNLITA